MQPRTGTILTWVGAALLALAFLGAGVPKLMGQEMYVENFERWGYPSWFLYVVGAWEVVAGVALLVPRARFYAAEWLGLSMIGAAVTHIRVGEWAALPVNAALLLLAAGVAWLSQPDWVRRALRGQAAPS